MAEQQTELNWYGMPNATDSSAKHISFAPLPAEHNAKFGPPYRLRAPSPPPSPAPLEHHADENVNFDDFVPADKLPPKGSNPLEEWRNVKRKKAAKISVYAIGLVILGPYLLGAKAIESAESKSKSKK